MGPLDVEVDRQTTESWSDVLEQFADASIYQTWAYGAVRWGAHNLSHLVLRQEGRIVAAAQLRIARIPLIPAGVAYLRWGPLCRNKAGSLNPTALPKMVACLRDEYVLRRGLALEVIPNVYSEDESATAYQSAFRHAEIRPAVKGGTYRTVLVDLTPPPDTIRKQLDKKWRNQLNGAEKNGLSIEVGDDPGVYVEFVRLYEEMWQRKQFETTVDVAEFGRMQDLLSGSSRMQTFLARKDGQPVGALVCSLMGDTAIYLLGATNERARELKAAYILQWQAMLWLKARGARHYDLGGIDPGANPGGYHFKSGFGGREHVQMAMHVGHRGLLSAGVATFVAWRRGSPAPPHPAPAAGSASGYS